MKAEILFLCGTIALMYKQSREVTEERRAEFEATSGADMVEALLILSGADFAIPMPEPTNADWDELRAFLKIHAGLSLAQVAVYNQPVYLVVEADIPFSVCMSPPDVWMPIVGDAVKRRANNAVVEYKNLISRVNK